MAFMIPLNRVDLQKIQNVFLRNDFPVGEEVYQERCHVCWNAGLRAWDTAPHVQTELQDGDNDRREVVIKSPVFDLEDFFNLLYDLGGVFPSDADAMALEAMADYLVAHGVEPFTA